jgi:hypothetical protein
MKIDFSDKCAKIKLADEERLEITFASGKVVTVESFASPDYDTDFTIIECVIARTKEKKADAESSKLNGYLWCNQKISHE